MYVTRLNISARGGKLISEETTLGCYSPYDIVYNNILRSATRSGLVIVDTTDMA